MNNDEVQISYMLNLPKKKLMKLGREIENPTRLIAIIMGVLLLSSLLLISLDVYANHDVDRLNDKSEVTQSELNLANTLFASLQGADISLRDYVLTGNTAYITNYTAALPKINSDLRAIKINSAYNLNPNTNKLITLTEGKENEFNQTIQAYQVSGISAAVVTFTKSEYSSNQISKIVNSIQLQQAQALNTYHNRRNLYETLINIASPIVLALDVTIVLMTMYLVQLGLHKERVLENRQSEFISIASHQLRTPATAVKQYIYLLSNGFYGKIAKRQKDVLSTIDSANNRSISIANNLLYVSQLESGEIQINKTPCSMTEVLNRAIDTYQSTIISSGLRLTKKIPPQSLMLNFDEKHLQLSFEILLDNMCRYTPTGKKISIDLKDNKTEYVISFKDEGIGMESRGQKLLFKKFSRLENGILLHPDGSGVGLYIVKNILELHGARYRLDSTLNKGTTLTLYFPT
jgi:signal transduction histidine kinase